MLEHTVRSRTFRQPGQDALSHSPSAPVVVVIIIILQKHTNEDSDGLIWVGARVVFPQQGKSLIYAWKIYDSM